MMALLRLQLQVCLLLAITGVHSLSAINSTALQHDLGGLEALKMYCSSMTPTAKINATFALRQTSYWWVSDALNTKDKDDYIMPSAAANLLLEQYVERECIEMFAPGASMPTDITTVANMSLTDKTLKVKILFRTRALFNSLALTDRHSPHAVGSLYCYERQGNPLINETYQVVNKTICHILASTMRFYTLQNSIPTIDFNSESPTVPASVCLTEQFKGYRIMGAQKVIVDPQRSAFVNDPQQVELSKIDATPAAAGATILNAMTKTWYYNDISDMHVCNESVVEIPTLYDFGSGAVKYNIIGYINSTQFLSKSSNIEFFAQLQNSINESTTYVDRMAVISTMSLLDAIGRQKIIMRFFPLSNYKGNFTYATYTFQIQVKENTIGQNIGNDISICMEGTGWLSGINAFGYTRSIPASYVNSITGLTCEATYITGLPVYAEDATGATVVSETYGSDLEDSITNKPLATSTLGIPDTITSTDLCKVYADSNYNGDVGGAAEDYGKVLNDTVGNHKALLTDIGLRQEILSLLTTNKALNNATSFATLALTIVAVVTAALSVPYDTILKIYANMGIYSQNGSYNWMVKTMLLLTTAVATQLPIGLYAANIYKGDNETYNIDLVYPGEFRRYGNGQAVLYTQGIVDASNGTPYSTLKWVLATLTVASNICILVYRVSKSTPLQNRIFF